MDTLFIESADCSGGGGGELYMIVDRSVGLMSLL